MAKFIFNINKGTTLCEHCPFADSEICENALWSDVGFDCRKYDFSTLEIEKYEKEISDKRPSNSW